MNQRMIHHCILIGMLTCAFKLGLCSQTPLDIDFKYYDKKDIAIADLLYDIGEDQNGNLWISNHGGGGIIFDGYEFQYLTFSVADSNSLFSPDMLALYVDSEDHIWAGFFEGLTRFSPEGDFLRNYRLSENIFGRRNYIHCFLEKNSEEIWIGSNNGIVLLHKETGEFVNYQDSLFMDPNRYDRGNRIYELKVDDKDPNFLWVGSGWGLKRFHIPTKQFVHIPHPPLWHDQFKPGTQLAMVSLNFGIEGKILMAGGYSGGLMSYDIDDNKWQSFLYFEKDIEDVTRHHKMQSIIVLDDSTVLYSSYTDFGYLDWVHGDLRPFRNFDHQRVGRVRRSFVDNNGVLWLAGQRALVRSVDPIINTGHVSKPTIDEFKVNNDGISIRNGELINVSKNQKEIQFSVKLINPPYPDQTLYRWRLAGYDKDWSVPSKNRIARYTNLFGGHYEFLFQSKDRNNEWVSGESVLLEIAVPFYLKPGSIFLFLLSFVLLLLAIFKYFNQRSVKKASLKLEYERRVLEAELKALRSQMNPHFIFNSLNSIYAYIHSNDVENATDYLAKFSKLMRLVLQNSTENLVLLLNEVTILEIYLELEQLRFDDKFDYEIRIDEKIEIEEIRIPPMIMQPYVENAIWHGLMHKEEKGNLLVSILRSSEEVLKIIIEDDGIGREKAKRFMVKKDKKSLGMKITRQRLDSFELLYNEKANVQVEDIIDSNGRSSGTRVIVLIPEIKKQSSLIN